MTPNQLPPLPPHDEHFMTCAHVYTAAQMHAYALAALAQQAQEREPVAAVLGDIVALWDLYAPSQHMTAMHMQAKRALAGQQPVSPDMHRWCAYVGVMVAHWVMSEPNAHVRLGDDQFEAAIAGIIERRLWAMPKRDTTPQPQPAQQVPVKCLTCSGHGLIGGHLPDGSGHGEPCPDCNAPTVPAPVDEREAWLPIETAPEDMPECVAVRWKDSEGNECRDLDYMEDGCWMHWHDRAEHVEMIGGHCVSYRPPYEHYMPLPPAPQTKGHP